MIITFRKNELVLLKKFKPEYAKLNGEDVDQSLYNTISSYLGFMFSNVWLEDESGNILLNADTLTFEDYEIIKNSGYAKYWNKYISAEKYEKIIEFIKSQTNKKQNTTTETI